MINVLVTNNIRRHTFFPSWTFISTSASTKMHICIYAKECCELPSRLSRCFSRRGTPLLPFLFEFPGRCNLVTNVAARFFWSFHTQANVSCSFLQNIKSKYSLRSYKICLRPDYLLLNKNISVNHEAGFNYLIEELSIHWFFLVVQMFRQEE